MRMEKAGDSPRSKGPRLRNRRYRISLGLCVPTNKLPPDWDTIHKKVVSQVPFRSDKDLYNKLCESILIEGGTQRIWLDESGKIGIMVSAKALDITGGLDSRYWQWVSTEDSRFGQVAEVKQVPRFEVWQRIDSKLLSPNTNYSVSFVLKINKDILGPCESPFIFSLKTPDGNLLETARFLDDLEKPVKSHGVLHRTPLRHGEKGWIEFVVGEFDSKQDDGSGQTREIEVSMRDKDSNIVKGGIVIDGVKIDPDG